MMRRSRGSDSPGELVPGEHPHCECQQEELILDFGKKQEKNYHTQATGREGGVLQVPQRQHHRGILSSVHNLEKKARQHPDNLRCQWDLRLPLKGQQALLSAAVWEVLAA